MPKFGIAEAQLVALFMESTAWGVQIVTVTICIDSLWGTSRRLKRPLNIPQVIYAIILFRLGTLDIAFAVHRNIQAFIYYEGEGGAAVVFNQLSDHVTVLWVSAVRPTAWVSDVFCQNVWKLLGPCKLKPCASSTSYYNDTLFFFRSTAVGSYTAVNWRTSSSRQCCGWLVLQLLQSIRITLRL